MEQKEIEEKHAEQSRENPREPVDLHDPSTWPIPPSGVPFRPYDPNLATQGYSHQRLKEVGLYHPDERVRLQILREFAIRTHRMQDVPRLTRDRLLVELSDPAINTHPRPMVTFNPDHPALLFATTRITRSWPLCRRTSSLTVAASGNS